jgi:hypothetical protein
MTFLFGDSDRGLDLYHVGLTVADLDAAMSQYAEAFGFTWRSVHESTMDVLVEGRARRAQLAVTYSVQGPPYLELIQERHGSVWGADGFAHPRRILGRGPAHRATPTRPAQPARRCRRRSTAW